jgi:hypothetical protein
MSTPTVPVFSQDGQLGDIPYERLHDALAAGFKIGVNMTSPDGKPGVIPADRLQEAQKSGFKVVPYDIQGTNLPPIGTAARIAASMSQQLPRPPGGGEENVLRQGALPGAALFTVPAMIANPGTAIAGLAGGAAGEYGARKGAAALGLGETGQQVAGIGGGLVGGIAGGGLYGAARNPAEFARGVLDSSWLDALSHPTKIAETILRKIAGYGPDVPIGAERSGLIQQAIAENQAREAATAAEAAKPVAVSKGPGPYTGPAAARLAARQAAAVPSGPPTGASLSAGPSGASTAMPQIQLLGAPPTPENLQMVQQFRSPTPPEPGRIVQPGSTPPPIKVTYQSVPREQLYEMAKKGNVDAGLELIRNPGRFKLPPNFKFMIEETAKLQPWRNLAQ